MLKKSLCLKSIPRWTECAAQFKFVMGTTGICFHCSPRFLKANGEGTRNKETCLNSMLCFVQKWGNPEWFLFTYLVLFTYLLPKKKEKLLLWRTYYICEPHLFDRCYTPIMEQFESCVVACSSCTQNYKINSFFSSYKCPRPWVGNLWHMDENIWCGLQCNSFKTQGKSCVRKSHNM